MCSNAQAALARIINAIDQLASDGGGDTDAAELAERIARIWAMVAELDPELARRWSGYEDTRLGRPIDPSTVVSAEHRDATPPAPGNAGRPPASAAPDATKPVPRRRPARVPGRTAVMRP